MTLGTPKRPPWCVASWALRTRCEQSSAQSSARVARYRSCWTTCAAPAVSATCWSARTLAWARITASTKRTLASSAATKTRTCSLASST
ncbi:hypothetical protein LEMLEM_LOCUS4429 [Lemmus lemmus]